VYIPRNFTETNHRQIETPAKLQIWAGTKNYQLRIFRNKVRTEVEIEWLAREVSDWLGIEITNV
jgi:hypothetical protein